MRRASPWLFGVAAWAIVTLGLLTYGLFDTGGVFAYALDDAYIHMAMAQNFAEHGVWGPTRYEFVSASSSPLWTATLAGLFAATGVHELWPLLLNARVRSRCWRSPTASSRGTTCRAADERSARWRSRCSRPCRR